MDDLNKSYPTKNRWLFSAPIDIGVFAGSAFFAFVLLGFGAYFNLFNGDSPDWTWISAVLLVDVAHVWSTGFRVYFDPVEIKNRFWLYALVPIIAYALGVTLYSESAGLFWRVLAYVAVFHFVRQQYAAPSDALHSRWVSLAATQFEQL